MTHGDLEEMHLPPKQRMLLSLFLTQIDEIMIIFLNFNSTAESNWTPCVFNIYSFTSCFLFSIETQHTIGYGVRTTTEECPEAIFIMCFQSIYGVFIQAFMVGIVFGKITFIFPHPYLFRKQNNYCLKFVYFPFISQNDATKTTNTNAIVLKVCRCMSTRWPFMFAIPCW